MSTDMESPMVAEEEVQFPSEPVENRICGYKQMMLMMNTLCLGVSYTFPKDNAGNCIIPGDQFCQGRSNVRITKGKKGTWVVDYKDSIMATEGKLRKHAGRKMEQHMKPHKDDVDGKTIYNCVVEDLDEEESKYMCILLHKH